MPSTYNDDIGAFFHRARGKRFSNATCSSNDENFLIGERHDAYYGFCMFEEGDSGMGKTKQPLSKKPIRQVLSMCSLKAILRGMRRRMSEDDDFTTSHESYVTALWNVFGDRTYIITFMPYTKLKAFVVIQVFYVKFNLYSRIPVD